MSSRSLASSLRLLSRSRHHASTTQTRGFSATPRLGIARLFKETGHAQLDQTLKTIQDKIILPAYLPAAQRKIVFSTKSAAYLLQNPVVVEVDGYEHRFQALDKHTDIPNARNSFNNAVQSMRAANNWENLPTLLYGYKKANIVLGAAPIGRLIRFAGDTGNIYAILECAKQMKETNLDFSHLEGSVRIATCINNKIIDSNGEDLQQAKQAFTWHQFFQDLLERQAAQKPVPALRSQIYKAITLYTQAAYVRAMKQAEEDVTKELVDLQDHVDALGAMWQRTLLVTADLSETLDMKILNPQVTDMKWDEKFPSVNKNHFVPLLAQCVGAIEVATEVLGEQKVPLADLRGQFDKVIVDFLANDPKAKFNSHKYAAEYEKIVGHKPEWASAVREGAPEGSESEQAA